MLKEISEQPQAAIDTMRGRVSFDKDTLHLDDFPLSDEELNGIERVVLVGMGTSLHAAHGGQKLDRKTGPHTGRGGQLPRSSGTVTRSSMIVHWSSLSVSPGRPLIPWRRWRRRRPRVPARSPCVTTKALRPPGSPRGTVLIRAGIEIAVAGSKTFMCSLITIYLLALYIGLKRGALDAELVSGHIRELALLPDMLGSLVVAGEQYKQLARQLSSNSDFLYLGRGINYPLAMEGALKLKEISYIHAEGYPAGEMKHGPISLIDDDMPVVALIPKDDLYEKMLSNVNEVNSRGGRVLAIASEGDDHIAELADSVVYIPRASAGITPMLMAVPMQLLAYHIAVRRGCDVDQPRNLAKSVTVE